MKYDISRAMVFFCAALAPLGALAQTQEGGRYPGTWDHPYMMGGWGSMVFGPIMMLLFWGLLTRRAVSPAAADKLMERIRWWEDYAARNGGEMNNNPSPGNRRGGLTTIFEKSLGAVAKGGTTNLVEVYRYAEPVTAKGFVFMDSPGFDPCSITGQVASGANVICFTTGRGSVFGHKPVPSLKLATNTAMYRRMDEDMDVNCGEILDGTASVAEMGERIFRLILETASGKPSRSEALGFGDLEFIPWQIGAVM